MGRVIYNYMNDCPTVPTHLSHKISQEQWDWINEMSRQLCARQDLRNYLEVWQIRGYWLVSYFMNPNQENLDFMLRHMKDFGMIDNNLFMLEFVDDLKSRVKRS